MSAEKQLKPSQFFLDARWTSLHSSTQSESINSLDQTTRPPHGSVNQGDGAPGELALAEETLAEETLAEGSLGPDDFQRIGVQPAETRLAVIRRAASRTSKSLASRHLDEPSPSTERQLMRVALSTYRLLDPRQRNDRHSRAHIGRIRPGELNHVSRMLFARCETVDISPSAVLAAKAVEPSVQPDPIEALPRIKTVPGGRARVKRQAVAGRLRGFLSHPAVVIAITCALLVAAVWVWHWGQQVKSLP